MNRLPAICFLWLGTAAIGRAIPGNFLTPDVRSMEENIRIDE